MKLFLATNSATTKTENIKLLEKSVISAVKNTNFDIHVLFDGKKEELNLPSEVNIVEHRHRCYDTFKNSIRAKNKVGIVTIASGAFLRTEIPFLCNSLGFEDEFVLYTDYDVLFQKGDYSDLNHMKPEYFAAAPESNKNNWNYLNSGVMLMNVHHFISQDEFIVNYIKENFENLKVFDQGIYNDLYKDKMSKLPIEYNWKTYWGINHDAKIVHFHGAKPRSIEPQWRYDKPIVKNLREKNIDSYNYYNEIWENTI